MSSQAAPDPIYTLRGVQSPVTYLIFHEDGNSEDLYSGTQDGKVHVWDMELRRVKVTLEAHTGNSVIWIDFTKDGRMVTFGRDGFVVMWVKKDKNWTANGKNSWLFSCWTIPTSSNNMGIYTVCVLILAQPNFSGNG